MYVLVKRNRHGEHLVGIVMIGMVRMEIQRELRVYVVGVLMRMLNLVSRSDSGGQYCLCLSMAT